MPANQRVLIVSQHFWPESFRINDLCDFFLEKNCKIDVLCGIPNYPRGKFFEGYTYFKNRRQIHKKMRVRRAFEIPRGNNSNVRIFLNYVSFPIASLFHIPRLLTKNYDKIFLFQTSPVMMSLAGIIIGKIKKVETTMYVLDLWPENLFSVLDIKNRFLRSLITKVSHWHYRKADKLIVLSEKMKARLIEITGISNDKIVVIPQVCEKIYETNVTDKELEARFKDGFNILFTGSITPAQSFDTIISAAKQLNSEGIKDINWIIVGDGMSRDWLENEVKKTGLASNFYFEGLKPIEDIPKYTAVSDLLVACLVRSELLEATIPAKVMSYFAAGRPMVLAMDGEVQDLVNHKIKCGYAGPTQDSNEFANNIKKIYRLSAKERNEMGSRGREYHFRHFERDMNLKKLYDFIFR